MADVKSKSSPIEVAAATAGPSTSNKVDDMDPAALNTNSNNPNTGAANKDGGTGTASTAVPIEVTPPQDEVQLTDFGDQSQAVPPGSGDGAGAPVPPPADEDAQSNVSSSLVAYQFKKFTKDSYNRLLEREAEMRRKAQEKKDRPAEGRLVDGELVYDGEDGEEAPLEKDPNLIEGNTLPEHLEQEFPKDLFSQPIEEIDELIKDKTFVVITKRFKKTCIHRFSATKGFFLLSPWNPLRRFGIYLATSQVFDYFIILTIMVNLVILAVPVHLVPETVENVFLAIYTAEMVVKLLARGFILNSHTYLRDPWNWLDFIIIITAYVTLAVTLDEQASNVSALRAFRVFRAVKTISIIPGLKTIMSALMKSLGMLMEVILLTLFCMMVFALFTLQVYIGILRQKCVKDIEPGLVVTDYEYSLYLKNSSNWLPDEEGEYLLCGNNTRAGPCPTNYTCLPDIGENPNFGYTSFDNFWWALLSSFQLITLDFWEDVYNKVIRANGPLNVLFFGVVVFFGSFYLINLMLAVVSLSYEEEALQAGKVEKEKERKREKRERKERKERERKDRAAAVAGAAAAAAASSAGTAELENIDPGGGSGNPPSSQQGGTNNNDANKLVMDPSHLQPLASGNVNGSNSASNVSLNRNLILGTQGDANRLKLEQDSGTGNNKDLKADGTTLGDSDGLMMSTKQFADDARSIISIDNQGDAPDVVIQEDDERELVDRNCQCCGRCCANYPRWLAFQNVLYTIVTDIIFELFISACVFFNVTCMTIEHHNMSSELERGLEYANMVFTVIFTLEAILKLLAMGKDYFKSSWNIFDFLIVIISLIDLVISRIEGLSDVEGLESIKVIRLVRLLRIFRLAQTWTTMRVLISIMVRTLGALGNLCLILVITIYIFAVFGMHLLGKSYTPDKFGGTTKDDLPRFRFDDFWYSIFIIFRILCGEWIEPLWECMLASGAVWCSAVFFPTLVAGNFVILNLFLALMLNSFATDNLNKGKEEVKDDKMKKRWNKLKGMFKAKNSSVEPQGGLESKKPSIADIVEELKRQQQAVYGDEGDEDDSLSIKSSGSKLSIVDKDGVKQVDISGNNTNSYLENENAENAKNKEKKLSNGTVKPNRPNDIIQAFQTDRSKFSEFNTAMNENSKKMEPEVSEVNEKSTKSAWSVKGEKKEEKPKTGNKDRDVEAEEGEEETTVPPCFPPIWCSPQSCGWYHRLDENACCRGWGKLRIICHKITEHKVFEYFILVIILGSSITLCFEDVTLYQKPDFQQALNIINIAFVVIFIIEMLLKWFALGFHKYFTSFWTVLDFCIVVISILSISAESSGSGDQINAFKGLRTLRALRPLRAVSRWQGMRIVVNALFYAIPAICNVMLVSLIFWLIFAIAGYNSFGGKFYKCIDRDSGERLSHLVVPNRTVCEQMINNGSNYKWENSKIHFDHVFMAYLALLQIATFEGWMELMADATDAVGVDKQPIREINIHAHWFFIVFIFLGSFFSLNLLIGVIIENFNTLKKKYEGGYLDVFLTDSQKNYYNTMKKLGNRKPQKTIKRPKNKIQGFFFDIAVSTKFELAIVILIFLNMIAMGTEHYRQTEALSDALDIVNIIFTTIFTLEAIVKIVGLRWHYFRRMWNVFDLIIVILSVIGVILDDLLRNVFITPTLLRVVRVFRLGRVLRLIKAAKGIRKLLFALVISLPALLNIGMLLFIIIFIYSIIGMSSFQDVKLQGALDDMTNFQDWANSFILLFRLTTAAGWNDILEPLMEEEDCNRTHKTMPNGDILPGSDCGFTTGAPVFMASYVFVTYLIIINMYIAVILENFNQAHEQEEVGITEDDFEMFYVVWERYDPHATQFIKVDNLSDLVADLDLPLGIPKPNEIALVAFDLPIMEGERLHCLDVLTALVKYVLGGVEDTSDFRDLKTQMEERYREAFPTRVTQVQISSTMRRKKEDVAAKTLQRAWRKHKAQQSIRKITSMAMEAKLNKSLTRTSFTGSRNSPHERPSSSSSSTRSINISPADAKKHGNTLTVPNAELA